MGRASLTLSSGESFPHSLKWGEPPSLSQVGRASLTLSSGESFPHSLKWGELPSLSQVGRASLTLSSGESFPHSLKWGEPPSLSQVGRASLTLSSGESLPHSLKWRELGNEGQQNKSLRPNPHSEQPITNLLPMDTTATGTRCVSTATEQKQFKVSRGHHNLLCMNLV